MTTTLQTLAPEQPVGQLSRLFRLLRLAAACVLTFGLLIYAWARALVVGMLTGSPEPLYPVLLAAGIVAVMGLTAGRAPGGRRAAPWVLLAWAAATGLLIAQFSGSLISKPLLVLLFVLSSFWVAWLAWIFALPLGWRARLAVLALLALAAPAFPLLLKTEGLTGSAEVNFTWRWSASPDEADLAAGPSTPAEGVRLPEPGPDDYPQFMGPQRLGTLPQARLARDWDRVPPRLVWRRRVGAGWGAFVIVGDYAITQEQRGPDECVTCYRVSSGEPVWVHADAVHFDSSMGGPGPRATPTISGGRVYTVGAAGLLNSLEGGTGKAAWSVNILQDNQAENIEHGVSGSPLVTDDLVIVSPTGRGGPSLSAYRRDTGEKVWKGGTDQASYSSPLPAEWAGVRQVLLFNAAAVAGHDLSTGQVLWRFPWTNSQRTNCSEPIPDAGGPGQGFVSTGYGQGAALFRVERSADGSWSAHALWESRSIRTKFTTAVVHRGFVYGLDDGVLACVDLRNGERRWRAGRYQHGQVLLAGDLLLVQAENGEVVLVDPAPEGLRELGRFHALSGKTWNNPALAGRFLLVRNDHEAACFELPLAPARLDE